MIHHFTEVPTCIGIQEFTDPFRYLPDPLVRKAADDVMKRIGSDTFLSDAFEEGKMLGVLVCRSEKDDIPFYIAAFSGNIAGQSFVEGFVPPIFDLTEPDGYYRKKEKEISELNVRISEMNNSEEFIRLKENISVTEQAAELEIETFRQIMAESKKKRDSIRKGFGGFMSEEDMIKESQFEKAELKRLKEAWKHMIDGIRAIADRHEKEIERYRKQRAAMSDELQDWIFRQYVVHNAAGESSTIADIFSLQRMVPPGGTGECAAPKLLEYAYRNGFIPLAMGEFWYGRSPRSAVRTHGHFYPSCTSKCGPLLGFMLQGLNLLHEETKIPDPIIIYEDETLIAVEKPSGIPSVPGLDGRQSLLELLIKHSYSEVRSVHRLDMDTSGIMIFAKNIEAERILKMQFEEHKVKKSYHARLSPVDISEKFHAQEHIRLAKGQKGTIQLPLSADYDERPRQKVDFAQGRTAVTEYEILAENSDGTTDIIFHPLTGRTHQLRVHSAHTLGLGRPIAGDRLYGGATSSRLHLNASSLTFTHPVTGTYITFTSSSFIWKIDQ